MAATTRRGKEAGCTSSCEAAECRWASALRGAASAHVWRRPVCCQKLATTKQHNDSDYEMLTAGAGVFRLVQVSARGMPLSLERGPTQWFRGGLVLQMLQKIHGHYLGV